MQRADTVGCCESLESNRVALVWLVNGIANLDLSVFVDEKLKERTVLQMCSISYTSCCPLISPNLEQSKAHTYVFIQLMTTSNVPCTDLERTP